MAGIAPGLAYGLGLLSALLLFASILLHELGHAVVARRHGVEIEEIDLWLLGGVARMKGYPKTAGGELRFALAGPAVTLAIAAVFGVAALALPSSAPAVLRAVVEYQAFVNVAILVFNLLPAFPLDGGTPVGLLDMSTVERTPAAQRVATNVGQVAIRDPDLIVNRHQDVAELLERPAFQRVGRAIVLTRDRDAVGIISITDVNRALRAFELES